MDYALSVLILLCIYSVLASSLNIVLGHTGLLSLSHGAFYGVGAYASALLAMATGWPFPATLVFAFLFTAALAALLALPLLRLRGDYFILGSLGFQVILTDIIYNWDDVTNGPWGLSGVPRPALAGFEATSHLEYTILYVPIAAACVAIAHYFTNTAFGRVLNAIREDEVATTALGKSVPRFRVAAFALSAGLAAVGGVMYAHYVTYIDPTSFTFLESVYILSLVVVGGVANTRGPLLGALVLVLAPELLRFVGFSSGVDSNIRQLLYGAMLMAFCLWRARGIAGRDVF